jgi:hypothetical protein
MADEAPLFKILQNASGTAEAIDKVESGDAPGTKNGVLAFGFRDSAGNVILPQLTAGGAIPVDSNASMGTPIKARGENAGSLTSVDVATITLAVDESYDDIEAVGSCLRESLFQIIWNDDGSETILGEFLVGAGQYSFHWGCDCVSFTAGASGTQQLILRAKNLDKVSTLRGNICAFQAA